MGRSESKAAAKQSSEQSAQDQSERTGCAGCHKQGPARLFHGPEQVYVVWSQDLRR
jgi:cytochrome c553